MGFCNWISRQRRFMVSTRDRYRIACQSPLLTIRWRRECTGATLQRILSTASHFTVLMLQYFCILAKVYLFEDGSFIYFAIPFMLLVSILYILLILFNKPNNDNNHSYDNDNNNYVNNNNGYFMIIIVCIRPYSLMLQHRGLKHNPFHLRQTNTNRNVERETHRTVFTSLYPAISHVN